MGKFKGQFLAIAAIVIAHVAQFWPFYFLRKLPFPGDILVGFYFPWNTGGFAGFDPFVQFKAQNTVDVIKQMYPWRDFALSLARVGEWPLWNPYSFSGMPFIANLQSALFFPGHALGLFMPSIDAWIALVVSELLIFGLLVYQFLRSERLSPLGSAFGGIVAMSLSFIVLWHQQLVITESLLFLPLILTLVNYYQKTKRNFYLLVIPFLFTFSIFGGHAQTVIYDYFIFGIFALARKVPVKKIILLSLLPIPLAAVQLLPSLQAYLLSAREGAATKDLFAPYVFPWKNFVTVIAPDFFGHPTYRNFWGRDYRDFMAYFGLTAAVFTLLAITVRNQLPRMKVFIVIMLAGMAFACWPLVYIFDILNVPILSSGVPARMIFLFQFGAGILAAYGFEAWRQRLISRQKLYKVIAIFVLAFAAAWAWANFDKEHWSVTRNNLIISSALFVITTIIIYLPYQIKKLSLLAVLGIFVLLTAQYTYFNLKFNPFSPLEYVFPSHPILTYMQQSGGINRFSGTTAAYFNYNFSVNYRLYDIQGYDSMYPLRYGEYAASANTGEIPRSIPRSDATFDFATSYRDRAFNLIGVRYLMDKRDETEGEWELSSTLYPENRYGVVWQQDKWRVIERKDALPRISLFSSFRKVTDKEEIIKTLYGPDFNYQKEIVLEEEPNLSIEDTNNKNLELVSYEPNKVIVNTQADKNQLLYLSDNYYPGWVATIDGQETPIYRANYSFRAIAVPAGNHQIVFAYQPQVVSIGLAITIVSSILLLSVLLVLTWQHKVGKNKS